MRDSRRRYAAQYFGVRARNVIPKMRTIEVPPEVVADRQRRASLVPRDLTAMLMGDPPPGWRVEKIQSPSIVSDSLDGLIFGRVSVL